jgi:hypothetical protein
MIFLHLHSPERVRQILVSTRFDAGDTPSSKKEFCSSTFSACLK